MKVKLIEQDGKFFHADEAGELKKGEDGSPIAASEEEVKAFKADDSKEPEKETEEKPLEELAKTNPEIARLLQEKRELEERERQRQEADDEAKRKAAEEKGEFQKLYEDTDKKLQEITSKHRGLEESYKGTKEALDGLLKDIIEQIPEDKRGLIPTEYSAKRKLEYIRANMTLLGVKSLVTKGSDVPPNDKDPNVNEETKLLREIGELRKNTNRTQMENDLLWQKSKRLKEIRIEKGQV